MKKFKEFRQCKLDEVFLPDISPTGLIAIVAGLVGITTVVLPKVAAVGDTVVSIAIDKINSLVKSAIGKDVPGYKEALEAVIGNKAAFEKYVDTILKNPKVSELMKKIIDAHNTGSSSGKKELEELEAIVGKALGPEKTREIIKMAFRKKL